MGIQATGYDVSTRPKTIPVIGARYGEGSIWQNFPTTAAEVAALIGYTPTSIWLFNESSGALSDSVASNDFSVVAGPPDYGVVTSFCSQTSMYTEDNSSDRMDQGSGTPFDPGSGSVSFLFIVKAFATPSGIKTGPQKFDTDGFQLQHRVDGTRLKVTDDGSASTVFTPLSAFVQSAYTPLIIGMDRTADTAYLSSTYETVSVDISSLGDITNTAAFRLGGTSAASEFEYVWGAAFTGANARWDGDQENIIANFWSGV